MFSPCFQIILDTLVGVKSRPISDVEMKGIQRSLPPPMIRDNWESLSDRCFIGPLFVSAVTDGGSTKHGDGGWEYRNEGSHFRPKFGFVNDRPGAKLRIKVNTTSPAGEKNMKVQQRLPCVLSIE